MGRCELEPNLNKCQYFNKDKKICMDNNQSCCFYSSLEKQIDTVDFRRPKWFEKYYN